MAQDAVDGVKDGILAELDTSFVSTLALVQSLAPLTASEDGWGPFEVVSHMSGWHHRAAERLHRIAQGLPPGPPSETRTADELNDDFVAERRSATSAALMDELKRTYAELRDAIEAVPEPQFWRGKDGAEDSIACFIAEANGTGHYAEHVDELRAAK
ncbi:MAG TPA: ClbS/DfsB family four-helix bundle protein [Dehalococcoidia bacterium]